MAENSNIQWTDATWNIARGCTKVSPGCKYCYMMRDGERYKYDGKKVIRTKTVFDMPLRYKEKQSNVWNGRPLIFTSSLTDFFHPDIDSYRHEAWDIIRKCPHLIFQILTKRPERIMDHLPHDWGMGWDNVWLGTSIENQDYINRGYQLLLAPAKLHFLSLEPLLGPIHLGSLGLYMDWVIIGGESGHGSVPEDINVNYGYRKCEVEWIKSIMEQCHHHKTPVFLKQLGTYLADQFHLNDRHGGDSNECWPVPECREFPVLIKAIENV